MIGFFEALWGWQEGYGEFRTIRLSDGFVTSVWFSLPADTSMLDQNWVRQRPGDNVYFGVLARAERGARTAHPRETHVLWCDVDEKMIGGDRLVALALVKMLTPNIIVDSGHGFHGYWLLNEPIAWQEASDTMKAIAATIHGDHVYDASRVMRVPGLLNYKDIDDPRPCSVVRMDPEGRTNIKRLSPLVESYRAVLASRLPQVLSDRRGEPLPDWVVADKLAPAHPLGTRSEQSFAACVWLLRYGYTDAEIVETFEAYPAGIGEKYIELGKKGPRWLQRTIDAARKVA